MQNCFSFFIDDHRENNGGIFDNSVNDENEAVDEEISDLKERFSWHQLIIQNMPVEATLSAMCSFHLRDAQALFSLICHHFGYFSAPSCHFVQHILLYLSFQFS